MATWVHPASWSQSAKANRSAVIVRKVRISFTGSSPSILVMRHAVTVFLWTSRPQHWGYITSIMHLHALRPRTGCPLHAASLLRASARRSDRRWCLRASRSYCWQACGTRIFRPSACGGLATSIALFMRGGEGYPHDLLLANLLQRSRTAFSRVSFSSFFAFKEGMYDTQIAALLSSPTVSGGFWRQCPARCGCKALRSAHCPETSYPTGNLTSIFIISFSTRFAGQKAGAVHCRTIGRLFLVASSSG